MSQEEIICPVKLENNLCLFYAIYNALPTLAQKQRFSGNNIEIPSQEFVTFIHKMKSTEETMRRGYSERDILLYLRNLKTTGKIEAFVWKRIKASRATLHTIYSTPPKNEEIFVLFGYCTTGEDRDKLIKRIKKVGRENGSDTEEEKTKKQIKAYHNFTVKMSECTDHAIAITNSDEGLLISDNAKKRKFVFRDVTDIARSLVRMHCMYVLRM